MQKEEEPKKLLNDDTDSDYKDASELDRRRREQETPEQRRTRLDRRRAYRQRKKAQFGKRRPQSCHTSYIQSLLATKTVF